MKIITLSLPLFIPFIHATASVRDAAASDVGRRLLHEGAPRPSPIDLAAVAAVPRGQLAVCLLLDAVGSAEGADRY